MRPAPAFPVLRGKRAGCTWTTSPPESGDVFYRKAAEWQRHLPLPSPATALRSPFALAPNSIPDPGVLALLEPPPPEDKSELLPPRRMADLAELAARLAEAEADPAGATTALAEARAGRGAHPHTDAGRRRAPQPAHRLLRRGVEDALLAHGGTLHRLAWHRLRYNRAEEAEPLYRLPRPSRPFRFHALGRARLRPALAGAERRGRPASRPPARLGGDGRGAGGDIALGAPPRFSRRAQRSHWAARR